MTLPKQLEPLRALRVWVCYPMIYNEKKHNGVGGYDKPPINPYTLRNGYTDREESLATYDEAAAQIGKTATLNVKGYEKPVETPVVGVGIAFGGTGVAGIDLDNVVEKRESGKGYKATEEALEIMKALQTYTEISPSGNGVHLLFFGSLPKDVKKLAKPKLDVWDTMKAEYQLFDSGYMTLSGNVVAGELRECTERVAEVYEKYFKEVPPIDKPSTQSPGTTAGALPVVSTDDGYKRRRWLYEVRRLSDKELLESIFASGSIGAKVRALYDGDISGHNDNHSEADLALCAYLFGFTGDRALTERLFRASRLYRSTGKSRSYLEHTLTRAERDSVELVGHIEYTKEEKRAYAQMKEAEEKKRGSYFAGKRPTPKKTGGKAPF